MNLLDLTLPTPQENLACDEALLDWCEASDEPRAEILRFWESPVPFVVVGYSNKLSTEVNLTACAARGVPVLRRCTGGGTVVQGPGSFNYSLILRIADAGPLANVVSTNRFVMQRHRAALAALLGDGVAVQGTTDLTFNGLKISGNAQRRKRRTLLFHGTFLIGFDLELIAALLPFPSRQPDYRQNRLHGEFLTNISLTRDAIRTALQTCWNATAPFRDVPLAAIHRLATGQYASAAWTHKF